MERKTSEEIIKQIKENKKIGNTKEVCELYAELIKNNASLIESIVRKFNKSYNAENIKDDLIQEGTIMLWMLADTYNENANVKFSTYAYNHIMYRIWNCINDESSLITMPSAARKKYIKYIRIADELSDIYGGRFVPPDIISSQTGISISEIKKMALYPRITASLNATVGENEDTEFEERLTDMQAEREYERIIDKESLISDMSRLLTSREQEVMIYILGIKGEILNMEEISRLLGISAESVRQAKVRAIRKIAQDRGYKM